MFTRRGNRQGMLQINGHLTRVMAQPEQWQVARISRLERISRVEVNTRRELEEIMATLDSGASTGETCMGETEKKEIAKRRKRKFMDIAVPHGIITCLCLVVCVIVLVNAGRSIEYGGEVSDYFSRQQELEHVITTLLQEFGEVSMALTKGTRASDLSQTYDKTDETIENFLPDKTLVKWTILNMLRDYRSSEPGFGPFHEKLVKQARFYNKVVANVRYTVQDLELGFGERHGWKLAYDHQLKTRQHFNVRILVSTLQAIQKCLFETDMKVIHSERKCIHVSLDSFSSFTRLEILLTELCAELTTLDSNLDHLSMSFRILGVIHRRILEIANTSNDSFGLLYNGKNFDEINNDTLIEKQSFNDSMPKDDQTNSTAVGTNRKMIGNNSASITNKDNNTSISSEEILMDKLSIAEFVNILHIMETELNEGLKKNWRMQKQRNDLKVKEDILGFSLAFLAAFVVLFLTVIFVTVLRAESELVVCVADWLKHVTDDLNDQKDILHGISKKMVPQQLISNMDLHNSTTTMLPYTNTNDATFLMFSISHFTSYFELFTAEQTIHILTLVMELIDERLEQYDAISVTSMGHCQIIFSDTSYNNRATHASELANLALDIMSCCSDLEIGRQPPHSKLHVSIGLHTGPCIGMVYMRNGVISFVATGTSMSVLQKVHKTAVPNRVQMTEPTYKLLEPLDTYSMYVRGNINVKDFSVYKVYWLNGRRISTGTSDCESMCSRIGSWIEIERKPLYRLDEIEGIYEPIDKPRGIFYTP